MLKRLVALLLEKEGLAPGDVELVPLQSLDAVADALTAKRLDAAATAEPFVSLLEASGAGPDETFLREALAGLR